MADCFIIMPITTPESRVEQYGGDEDHFAHVLDHLFCPAIEKAGLNPIRPIAEGADLIHAKIIANLDSADLVFCDMSCLNPNVFFELGIRTALNKPVCLVHDGASGNVPFDTAIINYHAYSSLLAPWELPNQISLLTGHITKSISNGQQNNSLWQYFGLSVRAHALSDLPPDKNLRDERIDYLAIQVEAIRDQLSQQTRPVSSSKLVDKSVARAFGMAILEACTEKGIFLSDLGSRIGLTEKMLRRIIEGRENLSPTIMACIGDAAGVDWRQYLD